jgi:ribose 5-phosphate isomerase B
MGGRLPQKTRIVVGADHAGFPLKEKVRDYLKSHGYDVEDTGPASAESVDYPDFAEKVAARVAAKQADFGVLMCGTGLGVAIAANKVRGIRAATCNDTLSAHFARAHNNANVLAMGGRLIDEATAQKVLDTWLSTPFEGGRHERRVEKIAAIEKNHPEKSK